MIWLVESELVAMVRERGLESFEFLCGNSVFVLVVPINSCLYEEWVIDNGIGWYTSNELNENGLEVSGQPIYPDTDRENDSELDVNM